MARKVGQIVRRGGPRGCDLTHGVFGAVAVPGGGYVRTDIPLSSSTVEPI